MPKLNILGNEYEVKIVDVACTDYYGEIVDATSEIRISDKRPTKVRFATLIHEMLHGINGHTGFPLGKEDKEEDVIILLGNAIADTLLRSGVITTEQIERYFNGNEAT